MSNNFTRAKLIGLKTATSGEVQFLSSGNFYAVNVDGGSFGFWARHTGGGHEEVAQVTGAPTSVFTLKCALIFPRTEPANPAEGMLWYDSTAHKLKIRTAAAWEIINSA